MRKAFSLLMVLMIALVVNAAPDTKQKGMAKAVPFSKQLMKKPAAVGSLHKAPMRKADEAQTVDLTITGSYTFYFDVDDEEGTSDWFFSATDDSGLYTVRLDWPSDEAGKYGTYTYEDLDMDYSYIRDYTTGELEYRNYVEGTKFTVSEFDGLLHVEGTLVCDNGVTYNLHFAHAPQTYNVEGTELTDMSYFDEDTDWYMRFNDDKYRIILDVNTGSQSKFAGTYTEASAVDGWNLAVDLNTGSFDYFKSFNVTFALPKGIKDPTEACEITGTALSEHGDTYIFHMVKNPPITPTKVVDLEVDLQKGEWPSKSDDYSSYFEVTEKDNPQMQWNLGFDTLLGSLETSNMLEDFSYRLNTATGEKMAIDNGTVDLEFLPETNAINVEADLVMKDSVEYRFSFQYQVPVKGEVSYEFNNLTLNDSYYSSMGYIWLDASNDDASFEMTLVNAEVPGEYDNTTASVQLVTKDADGERTAVSSAAIISASTTLDEHNQPVLEAKFLGSNKRIYTIDAHFEVPTPTDTLNIDIDGLKAYDYTQSLGAFQIYGYNNDSTVYVSLVPEARRFAGHYTTEDLAAYSSYCVLALQKEDGSYEQNDFYTADFDVTKEDDIVTLVGEFQAGTHFVNMTLKAKIKPQGIEYDCEDEDLDVRFDADDLTDLEKNDDYGYAYVELQNAERGDVFSMLVYLDEFDDDLTIPAGTYEVCDTYEANTVQPGSVGTSTLYPTFYATLEDGYLYSPFWFLTSGTVTVYNNNGKLAFEVNGQNSYECSIHVTYNVEGLGIEDVNTSVATELNARKYVENGRVIISRPNGKKYNLAGQAVSR